MVDDSRKRRALALSAFFRASIKLNLHLFDVLYNKLYNKSMTKSTTNRKVHNKPTTDSQQIDSWSKASNKSTTSWHYILSSLSKQWSLAFDLLWICCSVTANHRPVLRHFTCARWQCRGRCTVLRFCSSSCGTLCNFEFGVIKLPNIRPKHDAAVHTTLIQTRCFCFDEREISAAGACPVECSRSIRPIAYNY